MVVMTIKDPWHSVNEHIYHNNLACKSGVGLNVNDVKYGTGDKRLCTLCERLNKAELTDIVDKKTADP